jgi:hypothetical protein
VLAASERQFYVKQVNIPYKDSTLITWLNEQDGKTWIALKPVCEQLGIDWKSQHVKLRNDPRFSCGDITMTGADGKQYQMVALQVDQVYGWLYTINPKKISHESYQEVINFQSYCTQVIYDAASGQANTEVVQKLYESISRLETLVARQDQRINKLETELGEYHRREASMYGHGLNAQKYRPRLQN